jgi:hypothetical protein
MVRPNDSRRNVQKRIHQSHEVHRDEFLAHDHKRSNVETTFSVIKRTFGDALRSEARPRW